VLTSAFQKKSAKSLNGVLLQDPHLHNHHALRDVANQNTSRLLDGKHCGNAEKSQISGPRAQPYHKENEENEAKPKHKALRVE